MHTGILLYKRKPAAAFSSEKLHIHVCVIPANTRNVEFDEAVAFVYRFACFIYLDDACRCVCICVCMYVYIYIIELS